MKDRVFIVWSGNCNVAGYVKNILENEHSYICIIGGNAENNSNMSSVGDTVIKQMKSCNQGIVIFENKKSGEISDNLFFELGYAYASYGAIKVHCVKRINEEIKLPTDFDNAFVAPIDCGETEEEFARGIVDYFMARQKMSVDENKMFLIDNRYMIHEKILSHYSEGGSKCSDYELAQYILYYIQAAMMFNDIPRVYDELLDFKRRHALAFSHELEISVNIALAFSELLLNVKEYEDTHEVYIDEDTYFEFKKTYSHYAKIVKDDDIGIFDEWINVYITEHLNFAHMLFGNNLSYDEETRKSVYTKAISYGEKSLQNIDKLMGMKFSKDNHDDRGILSLFRAYVTRNMYVCKKNIGDKDAIEFLKESVEAREYLKNNYSNGTIDSHIYDNFCMEYYLALISFIDDCKNGEIDEFDIIMHKKKIREYLQIMEKNSNKTSYLQKLKLWTEK